MIRPAIDEDIPRILAHLAKLENPPYQEDVAGILTSPNEHVWVDDEAGFICRIAVMPELTILKVVWLFPRAAWTIDNSPLLNKLLVVVLRDVHDAHPKAVDWPISAGFENGRNAKGELDGGLALCTFWSVVFFTDPDDPVRSKALVVPPEASSDGKAQIAMTLALATAVGEKVAADDVLVAQRIEDAKAAALAEIAAADALVDSPPL